MQKSKMLLDERKNRFDVREVWSFVGICFLRTLETSKQQAKKSWLAYSKPSGF